jgi:hypothetical protein
MKIVGFGSLENLKDSAPTSNGVYVVFLKNRPVYVGEAKQSNAGFKTRLNEHWSGSAICRPKIYEYRYDVNVMLIEFTEEDKSSNLKNFLIDLLGTLDSNKIPNSPPEYEKIHVWNKTIDK